MAQNSRQGRLGASLTAAHLLTASQSPDDFGWIATFAFVPWFVAVRASRPLEAIEFGVMTGAFFGAAGGAARAIRHANPVVQALVVSTFFGLGEVWASESQ